MTPRLTVLFATLLTSTLAFAGIHDSCHTDNHDSRTFAVAYTGAVIDVKSDETFDGKKIYVMPALDYEQAFGEVCKVVDAHPELWERPSREAVSFAVNALWKQK
ncbi:MAG: hypothetical protein ACLP00_03170 [Terracidiphilus sp.]